MWKTGRTKKISKVLTMQITSDTPRRTLRFVATSLLFGGFIGIGVGFAIFVFVFGLQVQTVQGNSMLPTLSNHEQILVNKFPPSLATLGGAPYVPKRNDVVVIKRQNRGDVELIIKRVIALPGDRITIKDGSVLLYNAAHPEGYAPDIDSVEFAPTFTNEPIDQTVPPGVVFVLGDNRGQGGSVDSRFQLGLVSISNIVGKELIRIWPIQKFGPVN